MRRTPQSISKYAIALVLAASRLTPVGSESTLLNPFANGGCLYNRKTNWTRVRVCGSDDPPNAAPDGYCRNIEEFNYMELRIHSQNWESSLFETWILQILLSEVLNVPTSVETSVPDVRSSFYDSDGRVEYGIANDWSCLEHGVQLGDCRLARRDGDNYESCCHFVPEVWFEQFTIFDELENSGLIEHAMGMGAIGQSHWFVPKFTAEYDPTLLSYIGLSGESNRRKLADTFLRPTRWRDYCADVSPSNCQDDPFAARPPLADEDDGNRFFVPSLYQGHFRKTEKNNCDANNATCTGHIADYPCNWESYVVPQAHHLGIALEGDGEYEACSTGYSFLYLNDILRAANATKSHLMIYWWHPEALYQQFIGTDMELTRVSLPPVTQDCLDHRIPKSDRCSCDVETSLGHELGGCDGAPRTLKKMIGPRVSELTYDNSVNTILHSPGYETLKTFRISGTEIGQLFDYASQTPDSDPREAVCSWVIDHFDDLVNFLPESYPRLIEEDTEKILEPLHMTSIILSSAAVLSVLLAIVFTYRQRHRKVMLFAQLEFLWLLLAGLLLVSVGSLLMTLPPSNGLCVSSVWLTNLGYTLELVPLIVKMAAIYRIMIAAKKMRHVVLNRKSLFLTVWSFFSIVVLFLVVWTTVDPPQKIGEYEVTDTITDTRETLVVATYYCDSDSEAWRYASVGWHMSMLVIATLRAFQTRSIREEINESNTMAIMIYSHFVFVCLRLVTLFLESSLSVTDMMPVRAIIYSLDCVATISIYFVPKFLSADPAPPETSESFVLESSTVKQLRMLAFVAGTQQDRPPLDSIGRTAETKTPSPPEQYKGGPVVEKDTPDDSAKDEECRGEALCLCCGDAINSCPICGEQT